MNLRFAKFAFLAALAATISYAIMPTKSSSHHAARVTMERPLPYSAVAERSVLGAAVLNPDAVLKIIPIIRAENFFLDNHRRIYQAIEVLTAEGKPIDLVTLSEYLQSKGELEPCGGAAYLASLMDGLPRATNVVHYANIVKEKYVLREIIRASEAVQQRALEEPRPGEIIESAVAEFLSLASSGESESKVREWSEAAESALREVREQRDNPKSVCRINSGLAGLDDVTSGLRKKEVTLIVGATSHGKSLLAEQFSITSDDDGYKGLIFSAEMSGESIAMRQVAYEADVYFYHVRRPSKETLPDDRMDSLALAAKRERQLAIVDQGITPARVWAMSEARKRTVGLDFVVVDYDQLVIGAGMGASADPDMFYARQGEFIMKAAEFAKRLDVAFILLAQPRKMPPGMKKGEKPTLDDIYGHSAMRNTPHVIMWVVRDFFVHGLDKKYERAARAYVLKSRNDRTGMVKLAFDPQRVRFLDAPKDAETEE